MQAVRQTQPPTRPFESYLLLPPMADVVTHHYDGTQNSHAVHALILLPRQRPSRNQEKGAAGVVVVYDKGMKQYVREMRAFLHSIGRGKWAQDRQHYTST